MSVIVLLVPPGQVATFGVASGAAAASVLGLEYSRTPAAEARSSGHNALWMGHAWVDGRRTDDDIRRLADRLRRSGVRDVYVHVGPLEDDGSLDPRRAPGLSAFLARFRAAVPNVRVQAWLGNVVGPGPVDRLDLTVPANWARVVTSARQVLAAGMDGVHYDLEPLPDGDESFLALLDATSAVTRDHGAILSVAAEAPEPLPRLAALAGLVHPNWWSPGYLTEVANRVDQVALMTYDTGMPIQWLYGGLVTRQVRAALDAVPPDVDLLVGAPAYHDQGTFHHPAAETVAAATRAARLAYPREPARQRPYGVAIYVDFAATEQDWADYQTGWIHPAPEP